MTDSSNRSFSSTRPVPKVPPRYKGKDSKSFTFDALKLASTEDFDAAYDSSCEALGVSSLAVRLIDGPSGPEIVMRTHASASEQATGEALPLPSFPKVTVVAPDVSSDTFAEREARRSSSSDSSAEVS